MNTDLDEELIWKFLDGDLTRSESHQIEEKLELEEGFRRRMADMRDLDSLLAARTAELPSMRFATNVMERLAGQVSSALNYFALSKKFVRWYFATLASLLIVAGIVGVNVSSDGTMSDGSQQIATMVSTLTSNPAILILFQVSIGIAGLFLLDYFLRKKFKVAS